MRLPPGDARLGGRSRRGEFSHRKRCRDGLHVLHELRSARSTVHRAVGTEMLMPATAWPCSSVTHAATEMSPSTVSLVMMA